MDDQPQHNIWRVLGGVALIVSLVGSIFMAGMNTARNMDNASALRELRDEVRLQYMRRDTADLRFLALQEQLSRIERAVGSQ